jgi:nitrite reductase (NADH) large subunit
MARQRLVVIGNGMAGARAVEELLVRGGGERYEITVFGDEPGGSYNRILLSDVLNGSRQAGEIVLNPVDWYAENGITLHAGERVERIDRETRTVHTASRTVPYDLLLLATGSRALVPDLAGLRGSEGDKHGLFVFRSLDDCRRIAGHATKSRRAAVVGGGLLGLEAARGLLEHGVEVHVVHQAGHLMNRQLDPEAGDILQARMERLGVRVHVDRRTVEVLGEDSVTGLRFAGGETLECDMVVLACGIVPNAELARDCGLEVERAVLVDDCMRSVSEPAIYAVGECVQHRGVVYGLVAPLWEQARVLAEHLTGRASTYRGSKVSARLKVMGVDLAAMGTMDAEDAEDEVVRFSDPKRGVYKKLVIRDDRLVGAIILGDGDRAPYLMQAFERGTPLPEQRASLFFDLGGRPEAVSPDGMEDEATVCHCNAVTKGDIRECVEGGGYTLSSVMRATRAGTGCGSCKSLIRVLLAGAST